MDIHIYLYNDNINVFVMKSNKRIFAPRSLLPANEETYKINSHPMHLVDRPLTSAIHMPQ